MKMVKSWGKMSAIFVGEGKGLNDPLNIPGSDPVKFAHLLVALHECAVQTSQTLTYPPFTFPTASWKTSGEGSMWSYGEFLSAMPSISKKAVVSLILALLKLSLEPLLPVSKSKEATEIHRSASH